MTSTRERIIETAAQLTATDGWAGVTMGRLAEEVGVSRQTVYNELGNKRALAEAMVMRELERFLGVVGDAFDAHEGSLDDAIRDAARGVLELARANQLLKAVVSATHGADTELLPLLTTDADGLLGAAKAVVAERVAAYAPPLGRRRLDAAIDMVVRVVVSHVMAPSGTPEETADDLAWMAGQLLRSRPTTRPGPP